MVSSSGLVELVSKLRTAQPRRPTCLIEIADVTNEGTHPEETRKLVINWIRFLVPCMVIYGLAAVVYGLFEFPEATNNSLTS